MVVGWCQNSLNHRISKKNIWASHGLLTWQQLTSAVGPTAKTLIGKQSCTKHQSPTEYFIRHSSMRVTLTSGSFSSSMSTMAPSLYCLKASAFLFICSASARPFASVANASASPFIYMDTCERARFKLQKSTQNSKGLTVMVLGN